MGFGLIGLVAAACTRGSATPNLSPVSSAPPSSVASSPVSVSPTVPPLYPADVPLTGHNVRPGEKPPVYPAAAKQHSQAGANAFAEFFLRTWDWAYATTNPSYMQHYFGSTCGLCTGVATGINKTAAERHWFLGGRLTVHPVVAAAIAPVTAPAEFCSRGTIDETAYSTVDARGKVYSGDGAHRGDRIKICVVSSGKSWMITYLAGVE